MKITVSRDRITALLYNAIGMLEDDGFSVEEITEEVGISKDEYDALIKHRLEVEISHEERYAIAREVDRSDKITDIVQRVIELHEDESPYLNGYEVPEIIGDQLILNDILRRYEKAEGWVDNSSYWELLDDCIKDVMKTRTQYI